MNGTRGKNGAADKNNESRGGSKRWSGKGPAPARHIPWPEIFKHHISVVEGHYKMLDMVRKHTVEGTGNHRTITACLERAKMALGDSKLAQRNFVQPASYRDTVPIGSSSVSMYPGYSPADHEYGKAAQETGKAWAEAKQEGHTVELDADGPQYQTGQSAAAKRKAMNGFTGYESVLPNRAATGANAIAPAKRTGGGGSSSSNGDGGSSSQAARPMFVIDSNPTPIVVGDAASQQQKKKRSKHASPAPAAADEAQDETQDETQDDAPAKSKKRKTKHAAKDEDGDDAADADKAEKDDITERVEARRREKEEKRKKKEKKRKRESEDAGVETRAEEGGEQQEGGTERSTKKGKRRKAKEDKGDE